MACPKTCKTYLERTVPEHADYHALPDPNNVKDYYTILFRNVHISNHKGCCKFDASLAAYHLDPESPRLTQTTTHKNQP